MSSHASAWAAAQERGQRQQYYESHLKGLTARQRHELFISQYVQHYGSGRQPPSSQAPAAGGGTSSTATDLQVLQQHHRFIRSEQDDASDSWAVRLAKRYYDKLFKEYAIADLSRYKESKVGLRWRTQQELLAGKGQFMCGAKGCIADRGLSSYEVNFGYSEAGERKQALVKLRVCEACALKLNYRKERLFRKVQARLLRHQQRDEQQEQRLEQQQDEADEPSGERRKRQRTGSKEGEAQQPGQRRALDAAARVVAEGAGVEGVTERIRERGPAGGVGEGSVGEAEAEVLAERLLAEEVEQYFEGMFM